MSTLRAVRTMRIRRVAILIDGAFFLKRLKKIVPPQYCDTPEAVARTAYRLCKNHVQRLTGDTSHYWLDHVYRLFFYDAKPYDGVAHHPIGNREIKFDSTPEFHFRQALFDELRKTRKFALRLGHVAREDGWIFKTAQTTKRILKTREWIHVLDAAVAQAQTGQAPAVLTPVQAVQLAKLADAWRAVSEDDVRLKLRQKGVDMRIGIDISTLTLKKQVDTIILVTGDSDFVPAAKLARREGVEFLIDPLWQSVSPDLHEHVDGVVSAFKPPAAGASDEDDVEEPLSPPPAPPPAAPPPPP